MRSTERPAYGTTVHVHCTCRRTSKLYTAAGVYALLELHVRAISFKITCHTSHSIFAMQQHYWCSWNVLEQSLLTTLPTCTCTITYMYSVHARLYNVYICVYMSVDHRFNSSSRRWLTEQRHVSARQQLIEDMEASLARRLLHHATLSTKTPSVLRTLHNNQ